MRSCWSRLLRQLSTSTPISVRLRSSAFLAAIMTVRAGVSKCTEPNHAHLRVRLFTATWIQVRLSSLLPVTHSLSVQTPVSHLSLIVSRLICFSISNAGRSADPRRWPQCRGLVSLPPHLHTRSLKTRWVCATIMSRCFSTVAGKASDGCR